MSANAGIGWPLAALLLTTTAMAPTVGAGDELDLYGRVNVTVQNSDEPGNEQAEVRSNASRIGVKGEKELTAGLKAIYQLEWGVNVDSGEDEDDITEVSDGYFVIQPDITLHTNVTRWLRFGITGGYRFAGPVDDGDFDGDALRGVVVGGNIQAGWL